MKSFKFMNKLKITEGPNTSNSLDISMRKTADSRKLEGSGGEEKDYNLIKSLPDL